MILSVMLSLCKGWTAANDNKLTETGNMPVDGLHDIFCRMCRVPDQKCFYQEWTGIFCQKTFYCCVVTENTKFPKYLVPVALHHRHMAMSEKAYLPTIEYTSSSILNSSQVPLHRTCGSSFPYWLLEGLLGILPYFMNYQWPVIYNNISYLGNE